MDWLPQDIWLVLVQVLGIITNKYGSLDRIFCPHGLVISELKLGQLLKLIGWVLLLVRLILLLCMRLVARVLFFTLLEAVLLSEDLVSNLTILDGLFVFLIESHGLGSSELLDQSRLKLRVLLVEDLLASGLVIAVLLPEPSVVVRVHLLAGNGDKIRHNKWLSLRSETQFQGMRARLDDDTVAAFVMEV